MAIALPARAARDASPVIGPVRYAGFWVRAAAFLIDFMVLLVPAAMLDLDHDPFGWWVMYSVYKGFCLAGWSGQTIGKRFCGIRVLGEDLQPCEGGQAVLRTMGEVVSTTFALFGYLLAGVDSRKQALHDKLARTVHVYA
jgi:uncharacterized RDD family membrane protein YckC